MSQAIAKSTFIRTSPRKLRLVADAIRGMEAERAMENLKFMRKRAAEPLLKTLKQAAANAHQIGLSAPFKIARLEIDKGPVYKRWQSVSRGRAHSIHKFTSHISIVLHPTQIMQIEPKVLTGSSVKKMDKQTDNAKELKETKKSLLTSGLSLRRKKSGNLTMPAVKSQAPSQDKKAMARTTHK